MIIRTGRTVTSATAYDDRLVMFVTEAKELERGVDDGYESRWMVALAAMLVRRALRAHILYGRLEGVILASAIETDLSELFVMAVTRVSRYLI